VQLRGRAAVTVRGAPRPGRAIRCALAVHIGARKMAEVNPGEVLVYGTVKDVVVGPGSDFADREVRRGAPGAWRVFAVVP
jgi:hypothetical protein